MTTDQEFPREGSERAWMDALPRMSAPDPAAEDRIVARLREEGLLRRRRPTAASAWRLAAAVALFVAGGMTGAHLATRNTLEAMLARQNLSASERILLMQRAGSAYVQATERLAGVAHSDATVSEVATQTLIGAAQAVARAQVGADVAPRLVSVLEPRAIEPGTSRSADIIWY